MSWHDTLSFSAVAAALMAATPAMGQSMCGERSRAVDQFRSEFNESPTAVGLVSPDTLLEVLTSEKGTWTIIITRPNGASCLVASGVAWQTLGTQVNHRAADAAQPKRLIAAEGVEHTD